MKYNLNTTLGRISSEDRYQAIRILLDREIRSTLEEHDLDLNEYDSVKNTIMDCLNKECKGLIQVRNLITGNVQTIDANTPWSCRPDSESYWSS